MYKLPSRKKYACCYSKNHLSDELREKYTQYGYMLDIDMNTEESVPVFNSLIIKVFDKKNKRHTKKEIVIINQNLSRERCSETKQHYKNKACFTDKKHLGELIFLLAAKLKYDLSHGIKSNNAGFLHTEDIEKMNSVGQTHREHGVYVGRSVYRTLPKFITAIKKGKKSKGEAKISNFINSFLFEPTQLYHLICYLGKTDSSFWWLNLAGKDVKFNRIGNKKVALKRYLEKLFKDRTFDKETLSSRVQAAEDFISEKDEMQSLAVSRNEMEVITLSESIATYVQEMIARLQQCMNLKYFIGLRCSKDLHGQSDALQYHVEKWLNDADMKLLVLFGDSGAGKTTYTQKLTLDLLKRFVQKKCTGFLPVWIELRSFVHTQNLEEIIDRSLFWANLSYKDIVKLPQNIKPLFIMDGFDEMSIETTRAKDYQHFNKIDNLIGKVLITSRTHHFASRSDEISVISPRETGFSGIKLHPTQRTQALYIDRLGCEDIMQYFKLRFKNKWELYHDKMLNIYNLSDLANRPILLDLISQTLPELENQNEWLTEETIYDVYVDHWIKREAWRDIKPDNAIAVTKEMAFWMYMANDLTISHSTLIEIIDKMAIELCLPSNIDKHIFENKIRTASFICRGWDDRYSFLHNSFFEYFLAKRFADEICKPEPNIGIFDHSRITRETACFLGNMLKDNQMLRDMIASTKGRTFTEVGYRGGNAATVLGISDKNFANMELQNTVLVGADLSCLDLSNIVLRRTRLNDANLSETIFHNADFSSADMNGVYIDQFVAMKNLSWSPDGAYLAGFGTDGFIRIWESNNWEEMRVFTGQKKMFRQILWTENPQMLVFIARDRLVTIWDPSSNNTKYQLNMDKEWANAVTWDGRRGCLLVATNNGNLHSFSFESGLKKISTKKLGGIPSFLQYIEPELLVAIIEKKVVTFDDKQSKIIQHIDNIGQVYAIDKTKGKIAWIVPRTRIQNEKSKKAENHLIIKNMYTTQILESYVVSSASHEIASWQCHEHYDNDPLGIYEDDDITGIIGLAYSSDGNYLACLTYNYHHVYDGDYWETHNTHTFAIHLFRDGQKVNSFDIYERTTRSEMDVKDENIINPLSFSRDGRFLAVSAYEQIPIEWMQSNKDNLRLDYDKMLRILLTSPQENNVGKCLATIEGCMNYKGAEIHNVIGLTDAKIACLKKQGAKT